MNSLLLLSAVLASVKTAACDGKPSAAELTPVIPVCLTRCIIHECLIFKSILAKYHGCQALAHENSISTAVIPTL